MKFVYVFFFSCFLAFSFTSSVHANTQDATTTEECIEKAVEVRDQAIDTAIKIHTMSIDSAYAARAQALKDADIKKNKNVSSSAWNTFNKTVKEARQVWQSARADALEKYKISVEACNNSSESEKDPKENQSFLKTILDIFIKD